MHQPNRRKRYFIRAGLQGRYLRLVFIAMALPTFLFSFCLYYLIFYLMAEQLAIPESIAYNITPVVRKINFILLVGLPLIIVLMLAWGVLISHRIAGPVHRLERELDRIARGDFATRIKFRRKDELASIAHGVNRVLDKFESMRH